MPSESDSTLTTTSAPIQTSPPKVERSVQNKAIANYLVAAETFLKTASTDPEIQSALAANHGYDAAEFAHGFTLLANAKGAYSARQEGIGEKTDASEELRDATAAAREDYATFREIARACFPNRDDRVALGLTGSVPEDFQRFVTTAHTSYTNASKAPYSTKLSKRGYPVVKLTDHLGALDTLTGTGADKEEATGGAQEDTAARDSAYMELKEFMKELQGVCRGAFRKQAGVLGKLKL